MQIKDLIWSKLAIVYITRLNRARRSCCHTLNRRGSSRSSVRHLPISVYHSKSQRSELEKKIYPCKGPLPWPFGPRTKGERTNCKRCWQRVSRRHGRISPEERGRKLGRLVTATCKLCSVARQVLLSTSNFLGPVSLTRWVMAWNLWLYGFANHSNIYRPCVTWCYMNIVPLDSSVVTAKQGCSGLFKVGVLKVLWPY